MIDGKSSQSEHKLRLAQELLDDIELSRLPPENLLLKVTRLARVINDERIRSWTSFELSGYPLDTTDALEFLGLTGRWANKEKTRFYTQSLPEIDALIAAYKLQVQQLKVPDIHFAPSSANPHEAVTGWAGSSVKEATAPVGQVLRELDSLTASVGIFSAIRSRVLASLHSFVSRVYYELVFSNLQESIFERQKALIDARLASSCGPVLEKVPAVYDRLTAADPEAISQALNTCRRILDAFSDSVYPPRDDTVVIDGKELKLSAQHHQNRLNVFIGLQCQSESRRKQLRRALSDLYDRVSTGIHHDVSAEEARFLFLRTYLILGEILSLHDS